MLIVAAGWVLVAVSLLAGLGVSVLLALALSATLHLIDRVLP